MIMTPGFFPSMDWVPTTLVPTVQLPCVLLQVNLDSELCGDGLHCWVYQSLWVDSADLGQEVW